MIKFLIIIIFIFILVKYIDFKIILINYCGFLLLIKFNLMIEFPINNLNY